jgi:hypothetical protein
MGSLEHDFQEAFGRFLVVVQMEKFAQPPPLFPVRIRTREQGLDFPIKVS